MTSKQPDPLIRFPALKKLLGNISRSSVRRWELERDFPKRFSIGKNSVAWRLSEVEEWIAEKQKA